MSGLITCPGCGRNRARGPEPIPCRCGEADADFDAFEPGQPEVNTDAHRMTRLRDGVAWEADTSPEVIAAQIIEQRHTNEHPLLSPGAQPAGAPDDGLERNWDGQTREEFLDQYQQNHDDGLILMDNDFWRYEDEAIDEVGAEETALLRERMAAYLEREWADLASTPPDT